MEPQEVKHNITTKKLKDLLQNTNIDTDDLTKKTGLTQEDIVRHLPPDVIKRIEQGVENPMAPQQDYLKRKLLNMSNFVENFCVKPQQRDTELAIAASNGQRQQDNKIDFDSDDMEHLQAQIMTTDKIFQEFVETKKALDA